MICKWSHGLIVFEFDAFTKADEIEIAHKIAKRRGWKFNEMVKEEKK